MKQYPAQLNRVSAQDPLTTDPDRTADQDGFPHVPLAEIAAAVGKVRFGTVQIIIQDGKVVQIDTTDKVRLI